MAEIAHNLLRDIKRQADELRLQLALGKAEARDAVEGQSSQLGELIDGAREKVRNALGEERSEGIRKTLDELRLQAALGEMEGREAFQEKRAKLKDAVGKLRDEVGPLSEKADTTAKKIGGELEKQSEEFRAKLDTLGLNLGLGAIIAEEEIKMKKDEISSQLDDLSQKITPALEDAEKSLGHFAGEVVENLESILGKIRENL